MPESSNRLGGGPGRRVLRARRASKNLACTPIKEDAQFALLPVTYAHSHGSAGRLEDFKVAICKSSRGDRLAAGQRFSLGAELEDELKRLCHRQGETLRICSIDDDVRLIASLIEKLTYLFWRSSASSYSRCNSAVDAHARDVSVPSNAHK